MSKPIIEPGVYDIPDHDYHADPVPGGSLSCSGAKLLLPPNCPAIYRWHQDHPRPPKKAFDLGHAAHKLVLGVGPELVIVDADNWKTKAAQAQRDQAHEEGKVPLLADDHDRVLGMANIIRQHDIAGRLFRPGCGRPEQSLFWTDPRTDVWRRARLDWLPNPSDGRLIIGDYKTTEHADLDAIQAAINNYRYHMQAAQYCDAATELGLHDNPAFLLIFQEKNPPYLITPVEINAESVGWGRTLNRQALDIYRQCRETNTWPGHTDGIALVGLPPWQLRRYEDALVAGELDYMETA